MAQHRRNRRRIRTLTRSQRRQALLSFATQYGTGTPLGWDSVWG